MPPHVHGPASHKAAPRRAADRALHVTFFESHTLPSEMVVIRRAGDRVPIAPQALGTKGLGNPKDDIRLLLQSLLPPYLGILTCKHKLAGSGYPVDRCNWTCVNP